MELLDHVFVPNRLPSPLADCPQIAFIIKWTNKWHENEGNDAEEDHQLYDGEKEVALILIQH